MSAAARHHHGRGVAVVRRSPQAEAALTGKSINEETARAAGKVAVEGAQPLSGNAYKLDLFPVAVYRTILLAAGQRDRRSQRGRITEVNHEHNNECNPTLPVPPHQEPLRSYAGECRIVAAGYPDVVELLVPAHHEPCRSGRSLRPSRPLCARPRLPMRSARNNLAA